MWILPVLGLFCGAAIGSILAIEIPIAYAKYLSIAVLASMDAVFGGIRAAYEKKFDNFVLLSGLLCNALVAAALAYLGDRLGVDLYTAAIFVFGIRIFNNLAAVRHYLLDHFRKQKSEITLASAPFTAHHDSVTEEQNA